MKDNELIVTRTLYESKEEYYKPIPRPRPKSEPKLKPIPRPRSKLEPKLKPITRPTKT